MQRKLGQVGRVEFVFEEAVGGWGGGGIASDAVMWQNCNGEEIL